MTQTSNPADRVQSAVDLADERLLTELRAGEVARVARVEGDSLDACRLKALGVCEGRLIEVLRTGNAWVVRVLGSRIGVSRSLAASVWLTAA